MNENYDAVDKAVLNAVATLYKENDEILIEGTKINDIEVQWHVVTAISERIKFNANLHGDNSKPGAVSQVMLEIKGRPKIFSVNVLDKGSLKLKIHDLA